ncbi:MAG: hypothetical protein AAFV88_17090 [Planctomycetota bacterium]
MTLLIPMSLWAMFPIGVYPGDQAFVRQLMLVCGVIWVYIVCHLTLDECPNCGVELNRFRSTGWGAGWGARPGNTMSCPHCGGDIQGNEPDLF